MGRLPVGSRGAARRRGLLVRAGHGKGRRDRVRRYQVLQKIIWLHRDRSRWRDTRGRKRESGLIEHNVSRDDDLLSRPIEATVSTMVGRVPKEHAGDGALGKFMLRGGGGVGIAQATKNSKISIGWIKTMESIERDALVDGLGQEPIMKNNGGVEGLDPITRGHARLHQKSASDIVESSNNAFSFAVLLRGIWT